MSCLHGIICNLRVCQTAFDIDNYTMRIRI